ncbi:hypothetical protein K502DRAFT_340183 [Neoconidiobolus thromboides FSU 785]|nr:hypothetical protein K502DRAFT_340183 [Neoconidiobolus thromboides FSU 785]
MFKPKTEPIKKEIIEPNIDLTQIDDNSISIKQEFATKKIIAKLHDEFEYIGNNTEEVQLEVEDIFKKENEHRYMKANITDWTLNLEDRIYDLGEKIIFELKNENSEKEITFSDPSSTSQQDIYCIGRISYDQTEDSQITKLDKDNIYFEALVNNNNFTKVLLNIQQLNQFSFFPGQIIALKGKNPSGKEFIINQVIQPPNLPKDEIQNSKGSTTVVAAGPFTLDNNLKFDPLKDLLNYISSNIINCQILVLIGPFLADDHPKVISNRYPGSIPTFTTQISNLLSQFVQSKSNPKVILIPSTKDVFHPYTIFPQPGFKKGVKLQLLHPNIYTASNPAFFKLNQASFLAQSIDVLLAISMTECSVGQKKPRMSLLSEHLLNQYHSLPIYPYPEEFDVDLSNLNSITLDRKPNFLLLPSKLHPFCKIISDKDTIVVNPGTLCSGQSMGTFAVIKINPEDLEGIEEDPSQEFSNRTQVEIIKL